MFQLRPDHEEFRSLVRDFAMGEVEPHVHDWDRAHHFPTDLIPKMGGLGLFGLVVSFACYYTAFCFLFQRFCAPFVKGFCHPLHIFAVFKT